ncbi:MAG: DUF2339 domain-containing protein [Hyalangium sp.]|uniref:DUF2339 domain-containing protein n=1 Tax=Hyalangium sp. TaxID=2028555 RepID=UPI00389AE279
MEHAGLCGVPAWKRIKEPRDRAVNPGAARVCALLHSLLHNRSRKPAWRRASAAGSLAATTPPESYGGEDPDERNEVGCASPGDRRRGVAESCGRVPVDGPALVAAVLAVWRSRRPGVEQDRIQSVVTWYGLTAAAIATSWAFYFHFLTMGIAEDDVSRRLVLTLGWLVTGVALVLQGRKRGEGVIRDAGFAFIAISMGKALLYDTTHLSGTLRVAGLAGAGLLMLGGAWLSTRNSPRSA